MSKKAYGNNNEQHIICSVGTSAYYMKVPGVAAVLFPLDGQSQPITMLVVGTCPAAGDKNIMVVDVNVGGNFADGEIAAAQGTISNDKVTFTDYFDRDGDDVTQADAEPVSASCSNSVATLSDNTKIYITENAGVVNTSAPVNTTITP